MGKEDWYGIDQSAPSPPPTVEDVKSKQKPIKKPTKKPTTKKPAKQTKKEEAVRVDEQGRRFREDVSDKEVEQFLDGTVEEKPADPALEHIEVMVTEEEALVQASERFDTLLEYYKTMPWQVDMPVDLAWLGKHVAPLMEKKAEPKPLQNDANLSEPPNIPCPFHVESTLLVQYPDDASRPLFFKCPIPSCPVWCTSDTVGVVLGKLLETTHEEVRARLLPFSPLQCKCELTPKMRLNNTAKNYQRVFLSCGQRFPSETCGYFQWMDAPLWKPKRPFQPTFGGEARDKAMPLGRKIGRWTVSKGLSREGKPPRWVCGGLRTDGPSSQRMVPYTSPSDHPADQFLSQLGQDVRAQQQAQQDIAFEKRCEEENQRLKDSNMMPRSAEFYKKWGFGCF